MPTASPPSDGERRAVSGFNAQYSLASRLIVHALGSRSLEWVKVADREAGRLDDFQIATPNRLDAYQFKWAAFPTTVTFRDLTEPTKGAKSAQPQPSLARQLGEGWKQLRGLNPGRRVVVHLVTNDNPTSNKAAMPVGDPVPEHNHLAGFFSQGWAAYQSGGEAAVGRWRETLQAFRAAAGLTAEEFPAFARDCEFEFGQSLADDPATGDHDRVRQLLQDVVASPAAQSRLTLDELLTRLGWRDRAEFRNRHEFPDPPHYEAVARTPGELESRLAALSGGYLALVGSPGSGKSTLLTRLLRGGRPEQVIRYYAFVPDAQDPGRSRGEAANFFQDVCLSARRAGLAGVGLPPNSADLAALRSEFGRTLLALGEQFRAKGRRAVILIDGLDHIDRELRPARSLLAELPSPGELPAGVLIVFGTQTDDLPDLPPAVRASLDADGRRVAIAPLGREAVAAITRRTLGPLSAGQAARVWQLSDGHPLALTYLLAALREAGPDGFDRFLAAEEPFPGNVERAYETHAHAALSDPESAAVLADACRLRTAPDTDQLARWHGPNAVRAALAAARRYLQPDARGAWRFFHNSFRQYLVRETARHPVSRHMDPATDRGIHGGLAARCAEEGDASPLRRDELFHRVRAGDHGWVCRTATPAYFRGQLAAGRTLDAVRSDTRLARASAVASQDIWAYARLAFADDECERRSHSLGEFDLPAHLLRVGRPALAVEAIRDGNRLRVGDAAALHYAVSLSEAGEPEEASRLFDLAEPIGLLAGTDDPRQADEARELLPEWAASAPLFRGVPELIDRIATLPIHERNTGFGTSPDREEEFRWSLLRRVGGRLIADRRWDDLDLVLGSLSPGVPAQSGQLFALYCAAALTAERSGDQERCAGFVGRLELEFPCDRLDRHQRVKLAELLMLLGRPDAALATIGDETTLELPDFGSMSSASGFDRFGPLYRHARVLAWIDEARFNAKLVPPPLDRNPDEVGLTHFMTDVIRTARIDAAGLRGEVMLPSQIAGQVIGVMRRFDIPHRQTRHWYRWDDCKSARCGLYDRLVRAVGRHGPEALETLRTEFLTAWERQDGWPWLPTLRRDIAALFHDADPGRYAGWACEVTDQVELGLTRDADPYAAVGDLDRQSEVWARLGRLDRAEGLYARAVAVTARASGEDRQLDDWLAAFDRFVDHDPGAAVSDIQRLADGLYGVQQSADGGLLRLAAARLLRSAFRLDPAVGVDLFARFRDYGLLPHAEGVTALVRGAADTPGSPVRSAVYCLADLVVPFDHPPNDLPTALVRAAYAQSGATEAAWARDYLVRRVNTYGYPLTRSPLWAGMAEVTEWLSLPPCALPPPTPVERPEPYSSPQEPDPDPRVLLGEHGRVCTFAEAEEAVADLTRLEGWAAAEHYTSRFNWPALFERIVAAHPLMSLRPLVRQIRSSERALSRWLIDRGREASDAGDRTRAADFARLAMSATNNLDWYKQYQSDDRIQAARLLLDAAGAAGRDEFWRALEEHPCRDPVAALELTRLTARTNDPTQEWELVRDRLSVLLDAGAELPATPDAVQCRPGATADEALCAVLVHYCGHSTNPIRHAARGACGDAVRARHAGVIGAVRASLHADDGRTRMVAEVLAAVGEAEPDALSAFVGDLAGLVGSGDACVSAIGRRLAQLCGAETPTPERRELPEEYFGPRLLMPGPAFRSPRVLAAGEPLPDADDPGQRLATTMHVLGRAAAHTGLSLECLVGRANDLASRPVVAADLTEAGERAERNRLDNAGLKLTFVRPRTRAAISATSLVVGELWRAGRLTDRQASDLADELRSTDPGLSLRDPTLRPDETPGLNGIDFGDELIRKWVRAAADGLSSLPQRLADGRHVLAEHSRFSFLNRTVRKEDRRSLIVGQSRLQGSMGSVSNWCPEDYVWRSDTYPTLRFHRSAGSPSDPRSGAVVVRHSETAADSPAAGWLALNPSLAASLSWRHDPSGLFKWLDGSGNVAAESVWWHDGPVWGGDNWSDESVGRGWLVVASAEAFSLILRELGSARRHSSVRRSARLDEGEKLEHVDSSTVLLDAPL